MTEKHKAYSRKCTIQKHIIIQKPGKTCISKVPVASCGLTCIAKQGLKSEKSVPFACIPEGRLAKHYARKVQSGEAIADELRGMDVSFTTKMEQPRHCVSNLGGKG